MAWSRAVAVRADSVMSWQGRAGGAAGAAAGGCSMMMLALVPPMPNEFTAARRGPAPSDHCVGVVLTRNGLCAKLILGLGWSKLMLGASCPSRTLNAALIRPATPAAAPR